MCGIAGVFHFDRSLSADRSTLESMAATLDHRGPDGDGVFLHRHVGLAHRRLSIIGLDSGAQPLCNEDESVWVTFNGEIYNYPQLRPELEARGHRFRTDTDTEVLVHLYEEHGEDLVDHLTGMFAFAIYDRARDRLLLARDRVGIKPLYYARSKGGLWFASELRALIRGGAVDRRVNVATIARFLAIRYAAGSETLLDGVSRLLPGHLLVVDWQDVRVKRYWDLEFDRSPIEGSFEEAAEQLDELLGQVVQDHMLSDVPLGFLLSGGVDSTAILALAKARTNRRLYTFTIGFEGESVPDERPYARLAAEQLGTEHHETSISSTAFRDFLPSYVSAMEEPVCEPPAIALHYVSKLAHEHVKVVLSGEGGDEAFAGYSNYAHLLKLERMKRSVGPLRALAWPALATAFRLLPGARYQKYRHFAAKPLREYYLGRTYDPTNPFNAAPAKTLSGDLLAAFQRGAPEHYFDQLNARGSEWGTLSHMLYVDTRSWLPDDLLIKADKITMANSLELRVPFLDHRVLEFSARLPDAYKIQGSVQKRILRHVLADKVPSEILSRPKAGFPVPFQRWFREELRGFLRDLLLDRRAIERGYFEKRALEALLEANAERGEHSSALFCLAVLELWHQAFVDV